jgi:hypothetical protein
MIPWKLVLLDIISATMVLALAGGIVAVLK